ncbi:MAG: B12-binding domain-containing radical SAM protein [Phycisphaerae bacterium]
MKVSLCLPFNKRRISPQPYYVENLGIQYISSFLQANEFDCRVIVADGAYLSEEATVDTVLSGKPDLIGFSPSVDTSALVLRMCKSIRQQYPHAKICLGGQHATYFALDILDNESCIDFVVMGEGEETMLGLCNSLRTGGQLPLPARGLAFRRGAHAVSSGSVVLERPLDFYPPPERGILGDLAARGDYAMPMVLTSRGCPNRCSFCSSHDFFGGVWRTRNPLAVVDEMESICSTYGFTHFYFVDDQILGRGLSDKAHLMGIVEEILQRRLHRRYDLYSFVMMRADFHRVLTSDELRRFRLAGFKDIFVGFESGSDDELKLFAKGLTAASYGDVFRLAETFFIEGGFILFHPYATVTSLLADARLIRRLGVPNWGYYSKRLVPYPGTGLFDRMKDDDSLIECSYSSIRYRLHDDHIESIYNAVTLVENDLGGIDDDVFAVVDAYHKTRLSDVLHSASEPDRSRVPYVKLQSLCDRLAEFYYDSFLSLVTEPHSASTHRTIVSGCERLAGHILDEYALLVREGKLHGHR